MLYNLYEAQHTWLTPFRFVAEWQRGVFGHPFSPWAHAPIAKQLAASNDLFLRITQRYEKPAWRMDEAEIEVALDKPFCKLLHLICVWESSRSCFRCSFSCSGSPSGRRS